MTKDQRVAKLLPRMNGQGPAEIIRLAREEFGAQMMMTTAYGYSGIVLLSFVRKSFPEIPSYFIDTGYHFEESLKLHQKISSEWGLNIKVLTSRRSENELEQLHGSEGFRTNPDQCCYYRKVEPLMEIMTEDAVWLSATRRDQALTRAHTQAVNIDGRGQIKINPLYDWTSEDCWNHIRKYDLPYNPLHDQFYPSIGCYPCTRPADKGGEERSGRWAGSDKIECGLHIPGPEEKLNDQI
jgi:phosphoadenosine phosphosulfate reductase